MPRNKGEVRHLHQLPRAERAAQGDQHQAHWYKLLCELRQPGWGTVLDVGAASGYGCSILAGGGYAEVHGIDPMPMGPGVSADPVDAWPDNSADVVCAIDVIEHVEDDAGFLAHLRRVARCAVFITTPNWLVSKCRNAFHVREYTPAELLALVGEPRDTWASSASCEVRWRRGILDNEPWNNFGVLLHP